MKSNGSEPKLVAPQRRAEMTVPQSAMILKRFYFLQRSLVLMQAGWVPGTAHWQTKLALPECLWEDALIAHELRQRVLELRYPEREIDIAPDEQLLALWQHLADAPSGFAFAEGLRRVVKPMLRRAFETYLERTDRLDDGPSARILRHALDDIDQQLARWAKADRDRFADDAETTRTVERWVRGVEALAAMCGDLLEPEPAEPRTFDPAEYGGRPFAIARLGARDPRFRAVRFGWPDSLDPSFGPGEGLRLQVRQSVHHLNEVWAAEMAAASLYDLAEAGGAEFILDAARWCYDEIRHCRMGWRRLSTWGFQMHEMPLGSFSYDAGAEADALTRLGIIFYFESTYIHTKRQRMHYFRDFGDAMSSHDMDFDWADEQIHAHYGTRWLKHFLRQRGDERSPSDFRAISEQCILDIRQTATEQDRRDVHEAFEATMRRAHELLAAPA